jgi:hypothetical protein
MRTLALALTNAHPTGESGSEGVALDLFSELAGNRAERVSCATYPAHMFSPILRIAVAAWQRHYRIPEPLYWIGLLASATLGAISLVTGFYAGLFDGEAFDRQFVAGLTLAAANLLLIGLSLVGIVRWKLDRRRGRESLLIPYFGEFAGAKSRGADARSAILDALDQNLSEEERKRVHPIGAVIDLGDRMLAARLLKSLQAQGIVHGRAVDRSGGGWTVHARLARKATTNITHYDWHTLDATPGQMPWRAWFSKLPSTHDVSDQEFPLELTVDLTALIKALAVASGLASSPMDAEEALRAAIAKAPESMSAAMDELRLTLARLIFLLEDREEEALEILRERVNAGNASGELVRCFEFLCSIRRRQLHKELSDFGEVDGEIAEIDAAIAVEEEEELDAMGPEARKLAERANRMSEDAEAMLEQAQEMGRQEDAGEEFGEAGDELDEDEEFDVDGSIEEMKKVYAALPQEMVAALEGAINDESDPRRDISLYNLVTNYLSIALETDSEGEAEILREKAWEKLTQLIEQSGYYRGAWYVLRLRGLRAWLRFRTFAKEERAHSPEATAAAAEAAKWYSRAIRRRPHFMVFRREEAGMLSRYKLRSRRSAILDANAFDGHFYAGHKLRARYHEFRLQRRRMSLLRDAMRDLRRGYLSLARLKVDWAIVGRHAPKEERRDALENAARAIRERIDEMGEEAHLASIEAELTKLEAEIDP